MKRIEAAQWRRKEQESFFTYPDAAYQLPQWAPAFIQTVATAVQGNPKAKSEVEKKLHQLEAIDNWKDLAAAIWRMLAGESNFEMLRTELEFDEAYILRRIFAVLSGERTMPTGETTAQQEETEGEVQGITIDDLLKFVALACQPNAPPQFVEQMHGLAQSLHHPKRCQKCTPSVASSPPFSPASAIPISPPCRRSWRAKFGSNCDE